MIEVVCDRCGYAEEFGCYADVRAAFKYGRKWKEFFVTEARLIYCSEPCHAALKRQHYWKPEAKGDEMPKAKGSSDVTKRS